MTSEEARFPGASDWQAMDIFVFSNGQQYSPPRKYHLQIEDLDWWKSTLNFLARTQYGALHSNIELYTIGGERIKCPMELSNGACYVAVKPPDKFVDAGYEKYLLRASRSWEKRQSRTQNTPGPDVSNNNTEMRHPAEEPDAQVREENLILKTILSTHRETRPVVQPEPELVVRDKPEALHAAAVKPIDRRRSSMSRPTVRKSNPPTPLTTNLKPSFKRNDSLKTSNVKITKPDGGRNSTSGSNSNQPNKLPAKSKVYKAIAKEISAIPEIMVTKVLETASDLKVSSKIKIIKIDNDKKLKTSNANPENVEEGKETVVVSHFLQNPQKDAPIHIQHQQKKYQANMIENQEDYPLKINSEIKTITTKSSKEVIKIVESPPNRHSIITDEHFDTQCTVLNITNADKGKNMNDQVNYEINENSKTQDSPRRKHSIMIMTEMHSDDRCESHNIEENINSSKEIKIINQAFENNENFKINISPPQRHSVMIMTDICAEDQSTSFNNRNCKDERNNNNVAENNGNFQTHKLTPNLHQATDRSPNDQYVAVLNRGDVVNLKVNIEIKNHSDGVSKPNENTANLPAVNNIIRTEKESQINIAKHLLTQNKSLLSMIAKEINNLHNTRDNHRMFVVQSGTCNYCSDQNGEKSGNRANKSYLILVPVEKFQDNLKGCPCNVHDPHQLSSSCQPVKATYSCMSLQRLTKLSQTEFPVKRASPIHISTSDVKADETAELASNLSSEKDVIIVARKKSVVINEDSLTCTRQSSKICQEINQIAVNRNSSVIPSKTMMDNSTQTEWCDVLLEAKLVDNGHYAFHLPTLEMLKYYKLEK